MGSMEVRHWLVPDLLGPATPALAGLYIAEAIRLDVGADGLEPPTPSL